jgi:hypothetical protein
MNDSRVFGEGEEGNHGVLNLPLAAQQLLEDWRVIGQDELMGLELVALTSDGNVGKLVALVKSRFTVSRPPIISSILGMTYLPSEAVKPVTPSLSDIFSADDVSNLGDIALVSILVVGVKCGCTRRLVYNFPRYSR